MAATACLIGVPRRVVFPILTAQCAHQVARGYLGHEELTRAKFFSSSSDWPGSGGEGSGNERERKPSVGARGGAAFNYPTRWFRSGDLGRWVRVGGEKAEKEAMLEIIGRKDLQVVVGCGCIGALRPPAPTPTTPTDLFLLHTASAYGAPHATVVCCGVIACGILVQVKLRGFRIEVEEVEAVLRCSPLVRTCAVTVAGTPPRLIAWIRLEPSPVEVALAGSLDETPADRLEGSGEMVRLEGQRVLREGGQVALRVLCLQRMPAHQVPHMVALSALPLTSNGKIDRAALSGELAPPYCNWLSSSRQDASPRDLPDGASADAHQDMTELERTIALIWADTLGLNDPPPRTTTGSMETKCALCVGSQGPARQPPEAGTSGVSGRVCKEEGAGNGKECTHELSADAQFFELGGDSASAIRMLLALDRRLEDLGLLPTSGVGGGGRIPGGGYSKAASGSADRVRVWMCGLQRKPRLKDFCHFINWSLTAEPAGGQAAGAMAMTGQSSRVQAADAWGSAVLAALERDLPVEEDQHRMQAAALVIAASRGHKNVVLSLLTVSRANPDGEWSRLDKAAPCPLLLAAEHGYLDVVEALRAAGATVGAVTADHANGAQLAASRGHLGVVSALLASRGTQKGLALQACDLNKWSLLHYAASQGHASVINEVFKGAAPASVRSFVDLKDRWSRTALAYSLMNGHLGAFEALLAHGASLGESAGLPLNRLDAWKPALLLALGALLSPETQHASPSSTGNVIVEHDAGVATERLQVVECAIAERSRIGCHVNAVNLALACVCMTRLRHHRAASERQLPAILAYVQAIWKLLKEVSGDGGERLIFQGAPGIWAEDIRREGEGEGVDLREAAGESGSSCVWKLVKHLMLVLLDGITHLCGSIMRARSCDLWITPDA